MNIYCCEAWISLGLCHQKNDETEDALNAFIFAAAVAEDDPLPYLYVAESFLKLHKYEDASANLKKAEKLLTEENRGAFMPIIKELKTKI